MSAKPSNYAILFELAEGERGIGEIISAALEGPVGTHQSKLDELYNLLIVPAELSERLYSLADRLIEQAQSALDLLDGAADGANEAGEALRNLSGEVRGSSRDEIKTIISALIEHADQMRVRSRNLLSGFESNLRKLDVIQSDIASVLHESRTDAVTGLSNRRFFERTLADHVALADKEGHALSLLLIDIDHFKRVNDKFGHLIGDKVLNFVGTVVKNSIMGQDFGARYGGEEFAVILPKTDLEGAGVVAERIRKAVARPKLVKRATGEHLDGVTVSIGAAALQAKETSESFFSRADKHLYEAKAFGRNRVVVQGDHCQAMAHEARWAR